MRTKELLTKAGTTTPRSSCPDQTGVAAEPIVGGVASDPAEPIVGGVAFDAAVVGAYYGTLMRQADADGRVAGEETVAASLTRAGARP